MRSRSRLGGELRPASTSPVRSRSPTRRQCRSRSRSRAARSACDDDVGQGGAKKQLDLVQAWNDGSTPARAGGAGRIGWFQNNGFAEFRWVKLSKASTKLDASWHTSGADALPAAADRPALRGFCPAFSRAAAVRQPVSSLRGRVGGHRHDPESPYHDDSRALPWRPSRQQVWLDRESPPPRPEALAPASRQVGTSHASTHSVRLAGTWCTMGIRPIRRCRLATTSRVESLSQSPGSGGEFCAVKQALTA